jgi:hypothetical protein
MTRSHLVAGLVATALVSGLTIAPVAAKPEPKDEHARQQANPALTDSTVQGVVARAFWADGKVPGQMTPTIVVWSTESDTWVTIYGDSQSVRDMIVGGVACVGRFVIATGDRINDEALSAQGVTVPDQNGECAATI